MLVVILIGKAFVVQNEPSHRDPLADQVEQIPDRIPLGGGLVVLGDHAADDDAAEVVHGVDGGLEVLAAHVLVVDVDAIGREPFQRVPGRFRFVVEAAVEAELFGDEIQLLVRAHAADHREAFLLGYLADDLTHGAGGAGDEDRFAAFRSADLVEGAVRRQAGHA